MTFVDVTERRRAELLSRENEEKYRVLFNSIDEGFCVIEIIEDDAGRPVDYRFVEVNAAFARQTGLENATGLTVRDLVPGHETFWFETYGRIARTGTPERLQHEAAALGRYYEVYAFRVGEPGEMLVGVIFNDTTRRREAEIARELLTYELSHRVKNTLGVVQALARQTELNVSSVAEYRTKFIGRLQALSRAHGVLLEELWHLAGAMKLMEQALEPFRRDLPEAVEIDGPDVPLTPKHGLGLSMLVHELATNAIKFGSLSAPGGRVRLTWRVEDHAEVSTMVLMWEELGGPPVRPPNRKGFGTDFIRRIASYELGGGATLAFATSGLTCVVRFPLGSGAASD